MWTLILLVHAGFLSEHDSVTLTNVTGFKTQQECIYAGTISKKMVVGTTKELKYICVAVGK